MGNCISRVKDLKTEKPPIVNQQATNPDNDCIANELYGPHFPESDSPTSTTPTDEKLSASVKQTKLGSKSK